MGSSEVAMNAYVVYSMLGVNILLSIMALGLLLRVLYVAGRIDAQLARLQRTVAQYRLEFIRLRLDLDIAKGLKETPPELRGMVMALNQKIDLLMRHRHDAVSRDVLLAPAAPEIVAD